MKKVFYQILSFSIIISLSSCFKGQEADLIIHNANIFSLDDESNIYQAMAIKDGKIVELGPEREILNKYSGTSIDAKQQYIYPGFTDGHGHFTGAAEAALMSPLYTTNSKTQIVQALKKYDSSISGGWILGRGWNQENLPNKQMLTKAELDSIFPNSPVYLIRIDGHAAIVNSKALELAKINDTIKIYGGAISTTGTLLDNAMSLVESKIPGFKEELLIAELLKIQDRLLSYGITSVHEAGIDIEMYNRYVELENNKALKIGVYAMMSHDQENLDFLIENGKIKSDRISIRSIKAYADGALGSRGACMKHKYADAETNGLMLIEERKLNQLAEFCINNDIQLNTHCIGDSAFSWVCKIYSNHLQPKNDRRWRIEHAQIFDPIDLPILKKFNIIPSVQPCHAISDALWVGDRIGERKKYAYNYRQLKTNSSIIISGTDFPIESPNPIANFYAGYKRNTLDQKFEKSFQQDGALSKKEMLRSMTLWANMGSFQEATHGSLEKGKSADFIWMNKNFSEIELDQLKLTYVLKTYINGKEVYSAE